MEYYVIGDDDTVLGFSLVGVSGEAVHTKEDAKSAWSEALEHHEYAVIIITEDVADMIRETVDRFLFSESFPLVVEIPRKGGKFSRDLRELTNEAIGVSI